MTVITSEFEARKGKKEGRGERVENLDMHGRTSQLFLINALTCGLEVCLAAGTIYIPPLLLEAGVEERFMTMVLGVRMASLGLFLQCVTSVIFSLLMERMVMCVGVRKLYLSSVVVLAVSTAIMTVSRNITLVTIMAAATGYTFCTLQILPYTLTCLYHSNSQVFFSTDRRKFPLKEDDLKLIKSEIHASAKQKRTNGCINGYPAAISFQNNIKSSDLQVSIPMDPPASSLRGMGTDIAILDSAYLLSHVLPSLLMGSIVQLFHSVTAYMACASVLSVVAVYFSSKIVFEKADIDAR